VIRWDIHRAPGLHGEIWKQLVYGMVVVILPMSSIFVMYTVTVTVT
jgi:hypothetical protein